MPGEWRYDNLKEPCPQTAQGCDRINLLDDRIKQEETYVEKCKAELKFHQGKLEELKKVRRLISPEDEGKIQALREVGLL